MRALLKRCSRVAVVASALALLSTVGPASAAVTPPFDLLPAGPVPSTVPYAIGPNIFYQGRMYVVPAPTGSYSDPWRVQPFQGNVLASVYQGAIDPNGVVGVIGPTSAWRSYGYIDLTADATLAGQLVRVRTSPHEAQVVDTSTGRVVARLAIDRMFGDVKAIGAKVLVTKTGNGDPGQAQLLWDPATGATTALPGGNYQVAQRRGPGWLWRDLGSGCFARVTLSAPLAAGTRVCQDALQPSAPLLSFDGTTAVAVRSGRLVTVTVGSGQVLSTGTLGPIVTTQFGPREVRPVQWETTSTYLAVAKWDGQLAMVRCRVSDGRCERVVRSYTRGHIYRIVAGW